MENKLKLSCVAVVMALVCAGLIGVVNVGDAEDTSNDVLENLNLVGGAIVNDVAYLPNGTWGLAVGTEGRMWEVNDTTDFTAFNFDVQTDIDDEWNAVAWDATIGASGGFWVVGDGSGNTLANIYTYELVGGFTAHPLTPGGTTEVLEGIAPHPGFAGDYLVVGNDAGANPVAYFYNGGWGGVFTATSIITGNVFTDVTYTTAAIDNFIITGYNTTNSSKGLVYYADGADLQGGDFTKTENNYSSEVAFSWFNATSWNPSAGVHDYGLVVGGDSIHVVSGTGASIERIYPNFLQIGGYEFTDVAFDDAETDPEEALIVGTDGNNGVVLRFVDQESSRSVYEVTGSPMGGSIAPANCVAYKTYASPRYGIVFGGTWAYQVNNIETGQPIRASTLYPHLDAMELYQNYDAAGNTSVMNTKVDVDTGSQTEVLTLYLEGRHEQSWTEVEEIIVDIWFDGHTTGAASEGVLTGYVAGNTDNRHTQFLYTQGTGLWTQPVPGNSEIELISGTENILDGENATLTLDFVFNKQAWASIATNGFNVTTAGDLSADQQNIVEGLDRAGTWDIRAVITGDSGGSDTRYDETGVYIYEELTSSGLPGIFSGSGPPGTDIPLAPSGGKDYAQFSANYNYSFGVYVTDDMYGTNPANFIDVEAYGALPGPGLDGLAVSGGDLQAADIDNPALSGIQYFDAVGSTGMIYILGETWDTTPTSDNWVPPNTADTYTTTGGIGANPARDGGSTEAIDFICKVGGTIAEDNYEGTVVYVLQHE